MLAMYGKARVGNGVLGLAHSLGIDVRSVDDADAGFRASDYTAIIPTPGVNPTNRAYEAGNILSELDFAYRYLPSGFTIIAVTGTDGKSTTAWIIYELLRKEYCKDQVFLSGNFEIPFSETVLDIRKRGLTTGYIVLEVSSFMAYGIWQITHLSELPAGERTVGFLADYTVFTNFETDHINWHGSIEAYFAAKKNLVLHTKHTSIIHNRILRSGRDFDAAKIRIFGEDVSLPDHTLDGAIIISGEAVYALAETAFQGTHNALNILAAGIIMDELHTPPEHVRKSLSEIHWLPHRLELVKLDKWISYVDDSKSTSAQSLRAALGSYKSKSVILIVGGSDKGDAFDTLEDLFRAHVKFAVCIGATREKFKTLAESAGVESVYAESMTSAVALAQEQAVSGDSVLLSPGCASFGMFRDYLDRANQFKQAVYDLTK